MSISSNWGLSTQSEPQQHLGNWAQGAIPASLTNQYTEDDGVTPIPVTGATVTVQIECTNPAATGLGAGTPTVSDGANGIVAYAWAAADTAEPGFYRLQFWAEVGSQKYESDVFTYQVYDGPGSAP